MFVLDSGRRSPVELSDVNRGAWQPRAPIDEAETASFEPFSAVVTGIRRCHPRRKNREGQQRAPQRCLTIRGSRLIAGMS